jgi:hypothetical protein
VGPTVQRIFDTPASSYADKFEHKIEPSVIVRYVTPFTGFNQIVKIDGTDTIVGGATSVTYGLSNQIWARRRQANGPAIGRQIFGVGVSQSYYTDSTTASYDQQYQSTQGGQAPSHFSPLLLDATASPTDRVTGQMRVEYDTQFKAVRTVSSGANMDWSLARVNVSWTRQFYVPELQGFNDKTLLAHSLGVNTTVKTRDNGLSGSWSWNYDFTNKYTLQQRFTGTYNTQCCGVAAEFQTRFLGANGIRGVVNDRLFTISFTLAGIGTFANPLGAFGGAK